MDDPQRILIVDDEEGMRDSLTFMLESEGFVDVATARNGEQAVQMLQDNPYSLVITDLEMPAMNGYALMQVIQERWPHLLVVAITGFGSTESAAKCLRRGAFDYITKPFEMDLILSVIRRALDHARVEEEARRRAEQVAVMAEISRIVNSSLDIKEVFGAFTHEVRRLVDFDVMNIALYGDTYQTLRILSTTAPGSSGLAEGQAVPVNNSLLGEVATSGGLRMKNDLGAGYRLRDEDLLFQEGVRSIIAGPLIVKHRVIGTFSVGSRQPNRYDEKTEDVVRKIGELVATAANNMLLFGQLQSQLTRLRRTQSQLIRSARLAAVGEMADGVAHEINNPLSVVLGVTQLLLRQGDTPPHIVQELEKIAVSANRIASVTRSFIEFARPAPLGQQHPIEVAELVDSALLLVQSQMDSGMDSFEIKRLFAPNLPLVMGNEGQLRRALVNIIRNAMEAITKAPPPAEGHLLTLQLDSIRESGHPFVEITIQDTGQGIPSGRMNRIFEPGFTTKVEKGTVKGLGMGLFASYGIVDAHGGDINIESKTGEGTKVTVKLPALA